MTQRRGFRVVSALVTILVVLGMLAITLGPYLIERGNRPATTTVVTGLRI
ncbi:MAG: hypothetical protein ACR2OI_09065 [Acidimicrobiia bacterium]